VHTASSPSTALYCASDIPRGASNRSPTTPHKRVSFSVEPVRSVKDLLYNPRDSGALADTVNEVWMGHEAGILGVGLRVLMACQAFVERVTSSVTGVDDVFPIRIVRSSAVCVPEGGFPGDHLIWPQPVARELLEGRSPVRVPCCACWLH